MADKIINEKKANNNYILDGDVYRVPKPQEAVAVNYTALGTDGAYIEGNKDNKTIILLDGSGTAVVRGGNSYAGLGTSGDLSIAVSGPTFVTLDSARFADKFTGRIKIDGNGVKAAVLEVR